MPRIYENIKENFTNFDHFKEVACKTLNEMYGRVRPLDVFDFAFTETHYKALGYYAEEDIPAVQENGEPVSEDADAAERLARETEEQNKAIAEAELKAEIERVTQLIADGAGISFEELVFAKNNGVAITDHIKAQLAEQVKKGRMSYEAAFTAGLDEIDGLPTLEAAKAALRAAVVEAQKQNEEAAKSELPEDEKVIPPGVKEIDGVVASDAAIALAEANGVDLKLVPATGRDDIIKESDVADYIANNAPLKENADANGSEQSNA